MRVLGFLSLLVVIAVVADQATANTIPQRVEAIVREVALRVEEDAKLRLQSLSPRGRLRARRSSQRGLDMYMRNQIIRISVNEVLERVDSTLSKKEARELVLEALEKISKENSNLTIDFNTVDAMCNFRNVSCDPTARYREVTGICNNLQNPYWGSSGIPMRRLLPHAYQDGIEAPRGGYGTSILRRAESSVCNGKKCKGDQSGKCPSAPNPSLPNPRVVSSTIHPDLNEQHVGLTNMFMQLGQFLDHDVTLTPEPELHCCSSEAGDPECFPIQVYGNDSFYAPHSVTCLALSRSIAFCDGNTKKREQMNDITAFVDASNVYGSDESTLRSLRAFQGGKLKTTVINANELLPVIDGEFKAGDIRALDMPGLASMHTIFLREHNRIAEKLSQFCNDDEVIFQETRRIVAAEMQNIIYNEYLPILVGRKGLKQTNSQSESIRTKYDSRVNPSVFNAFATAAFRFGHTLIRGLIAMIDQNPNEQRIFHLRDHFFNSENYVDGDGGGVERLMRGLMTQPTMAYDRFITSEVTNFLFKEEMDQFGSDLVARNIQRGREHGMPGYNDYREICGLPRICSWDKPPSEIPEKIWDSFASLYEHPNDIDLFSAGIAEKPTKFSGLTGPTFNCIISQQFNALRDGDRFFYTHGNQAGSFNDEQLENLSQRTLADIICDNTKLTTTRERVLELSSPMRSCTNGNQLDLSLFSNELQNRKL